MSKDTLYFIMREKSEMVPCAIGSAGTGRALVDDCKVMVTRICCAAPFQVLHPVAEWRTVEKAEKLVLGAVNGSAFLADMLPWFTTDKHIAQDYIDKLRTRDGGDGQYTVEELHYTCGALNVNEGELREACQVAQSYMDHMMEGTYEQGR